MSRRVLDAEAGFAMVESIAVLVLSALALLTLVIATDLVSRNSAAAARGANTIETLAMGFAAVRRDLEATRFIRIGTQAEDPILFSGGPNAVALAVASDGTGTNAGEGLVLIEARYENGRGVLIRSSAPMRPGTVGFGEAQFANPAVLMSGPWHYRFAYDDLQPGGLRWGGQWSAANRLPASIRLEVLNDAGHRIAPPLVVRLPVDSGGCAEAAHVDCAAAAQTTEDSNQEQDPNQNPDGKPGNEDQGNGQGG
jgi:hypothetical protein